MTEQERWRWLHRGLAFLLSLSLLGMTYVLFDPDLGTDVPLFQEFTCRGKLVVTATDPVGRSALRVPEMALKMTATGDDDLRPARFTLFIREDERSDWREYFSVTIPSGEHLMYVSPVANETQVYVTAKDITGLYCHGRSGIVEVPHDRNNDLGV